MRRVVAFVRDAEWLSAERARGYFVIWLTLQAGIAIYMAFSFHAASVAESGRPVASDFMTFWSAARMVVLHGPLAAYDDTGRALLQRAAGAMGTEPGAHYAYWYPPPFLLLSLPLGLVGYVAALSGFLAAGYAALIVCLRRLLPSAIGVAALIASPVMLLNTIIGQNGALTASCFAGAALLLDAAPVWAGACLGLLVCKPHLAILVPLALAAAGRWRAFVSCGATALALCAASLLCFGAGAWRLFLSHSGEARTVLENYPVDWAKIQSVFSAARLLGGSIATAYSVHAVCALAAAMVVWQVARARPGAAIEMAVLTVGALIVTPYMFDYDLVCLLVPMACVSALALHGRWLAWEKAVLLLVYVLPLAARMVATNFGWPLMPVPMFLLLFICARRGLRRYPVPVA
jgi:hypothetical protein